MADLISRKLYKLEGKTGRVHLEFPLSDTVHIKLYEWENISILSEKYEIEEDFTHEFRVNRFTLDPDSLVKAIEAVDRWQMRVDYNCISDILFFLAFPTSDEALLAKLSLH